jgi:hypothetical protein
MTCALHTYTYIHTGAVHVVCTWRYICMYVTCHVGHVSIVKKKKKRHTTALHLVYIYIYKSRYTCIFIYIYRIPVPASLDWMIYNFYRYLLILTWVLSIVWSLNCLRLIYRFLIGLRPTLQVLKTSIYWGLYNRAIITEILRCLRLCGDFPSVWRVPCQVWALPFENL